MVLVDDFGKFGLFALFVLDNSSLPLVNLEADCIGQLLVMCVYVWVLQVGEMAVKVNSLLIKI